MNVNRTASSLLHPALTICLIVLLSWPIKNTYSNEGLARLATPLVDPLLTLPPEIKTDSTSSIRSQAPPCPMMNSFQLQFKSRTRRQASGDETVQSVRRGAAQRSRQSYTNEMELESEIEPVSLADAVDLALCNNPQIKSAWAAIKIQAATVGEARAAYLPTLSANASRMHDQVKQGNLNNNVESSTVYGNLSWRVFDFGGRGANRHAANALLSAALASHQATLQKTLANVVNAYYETQATLAAWQTKVLNEAALQKIFAAAQRRQAQGVGAQTDTLQVATALARMTLEKNRTQAAHQKTLAVLAQTLGLPPQTKLVLSDDMADSHSNSFPKVEREGEHAATRQYKKQYGEEPLSEADKVIRMKGDWNQLVRQDLDAWLNEIQKQHPALLAARQQVLSAQQKVWATTSEGLPTIDFSATYYKNGRPNQSLTPNVKETLYGLTLTIPLFDGFARTYKVRGTQALLEQKQAELFDTEQQVLLDVIKAHAEASTSLDNLSAAKKYLENAQLTLDSVQRKFTRGAADIPAILNTQIELANAQQEHIRCLTEWRSAKLRLFAYAGVLERTDIK